MKPITEDKTETVAIKTLRFNPQSSFYLQPHIPPNAQEKAIQKVLRIHSPGLLHNNETFHQLLVEKVKIPFRKDGFEFSYEMALVDFENTLNKEIMTLRPECQNDDLSN
jgi:type I site-specific restriction-modification system R (restriction) subunit